MNERIKELWNNAAESTAAFSSGQNNSWETQVNFMERFAELIVRECADVARQADIDGCNIGNRAWSKIKKHFGIE